MINLVPYLEDLESRIDEAEEATLLAEWQSFSRGEFTGEIFAPWRSRAYPPGLEWPHPLVNEALDDFDAMVLQQLGACSQELAGGTGKLLCARPNYGTPTLPSLFGVEIFRPADEIDTLPASRPLSRAALSAALEAGVPNLHQSLGGQALEAGERYLEVFAPYPRITRHVHLYSPDTQSPMDICEMLWGSTIFVEAYDQPERIHALLEVVTQTYSAFVREWRARVPARPDGTAVYLGLLHGGHILLRDDSAMNFSPAMYEEFFVPYEQRLLRELGGGTLHFCGKGDHYLPRAIQQEGLHAVNLTEPKYNDMEVIYRCTVDRGLQLVGLARDCAERSLAAGRDLHGNVNVS